MTAKKTCKHAVVFRSIDGEEWNCQECGAKFYHLEDIGFPGQKLTIMESMPTLRDQFAMASMLADAMQSAIIAATYIAQGKRFDGDVPELSEGVKEHYRTADAMLEARK
jgi:hypothetical protein